MSDVTARLRYLMEYLDLNQSELARRLKLTRSAVHRWVSGDGRIPDGPSLLALRKVTGVSVDWLLTGEGEMLRHADEESASSRLARVKQITRD